MSIVNFRMQVAEDKSYITFASEQSVTNSKGFVVIRFYKPNSNYAQFGLTPDECNALAKMCDTTVRSSKKQWLACRQNISPVMGGQINILVPDFIHEGKYVLTIQFYLNGVYREHNFTNAEAEQFMFFLKSSGQAARQFK